VRGGSSVKQKLETAFAKGEGFLLTYSSVDVLSGLASSKSPVGLGGYPKLA
jgi:hypothetical protein